MIAANLELNYSLVEKILVNFFKEEYKKVGFSKAVFGLSGGVDSALVAYIAAKALGPENVTGVLLPYKKSSKASVDHAMLVVNALGINHEIIDISEMADAYIKLDKGISKLRMGNVMSRCRMIVLYDFSVKLNALVAGTSNKTELLLGYGTQFGDMASAVNAIGDLYKVQVWDLSRHMGVPIEIIEKPPTADLWEDQTDESELGFSYKNVDELLYLLIDKRYDRDMLIEAGFADEFVDKVIKKIQLNQYKRKLPTIAKISGRSIPHDFRYARDWGF